tara:strand:- start:727 stop:1413 length:687 start_codon:yes stop_codon:yes gene_type:complete
LNGTIALAGGDEFSPHSVSMDTSLMNWPLERPFKLLIVPSAAVERPEKAALNGIKYFGQLGVAASPLMITSNAMANDKVLCRPILDASHLFFTGGDPGHLLGVLSNSIMVDYMFQFLIQGGVLIGSSAGAMVLGEWIRNPTSGHWNKGLGFVKGIGIIPHHEKLNPAMVHKNLSPFIQTDRNVWGIDIGTCCIGSQGNWIVQGQGMVTVYTVNGWASFSDGLLLPNSI